MSDPDIDVTSSVRDLLERCRALALDHLCGDELVDLLRAIDAVLDPPETLGLYCRFCDFRFNVEVANIHTKKFRNRLQDKRVNCPQCSRCGEVVETL